MGQMASNLGNSNVTDPRQAQWGDLDSSEKGARVLAGGVRGLGQGMQTMNQPQGGMPQINPMQFGQSQVPQFGTDNLPGQSRKPNPFYGGYGI